MSWAVGYDSNWKRDIGYGVPATCDHPGCGTRINRGLAYVCAQETPYGGEGCGLFFCEQHSDLAGFCQRCHEARWRRVRGAVRPPAVPFERTPDLPEWLRHKLTHESWKDWCDLHPTEAEAARTLLLCLETRGTTEGQPLAQPASIPEST